MSERGEDRSESAIPANPPARADLRGEGARWKRTRWGNWFRWSFLGSTWEPEEEPPTLLKITASAVPHSEGDVIWVQEPDGTWRRGADEPPRPEEQAPAAPPAPTADPLADAGWSRARGRDVPHEPPSARRHRSNELGPFQFFVVTFGACMAVSVLAVAGALALAVLDLFLMGIFDNDDGFEVVGEVAKVCGALTAGIVPGVTIAREAFRMRRVALGFQSFLVFAGIALVGGGVYLSTRV
jgi:hypothetical protein